MLYRLQHRGPAPDAHSFRVGIGYVAKRVSEEVAAMVKESGKRPTAMKSVLFKLKLLKITSSSCVLNMASTSDTGTIAWSFQTIGLPQPTCFAEEDFSGMARAFLRLPSFSGRHASPTFVHIYLK